MKVSVCITVFNEEGSVGRLLDSLLRQTKKPDEIVIVDGGSSDNTVGVIKKYQKKNENIKLIVEPGSTAEGRNASIKNARHKIIATTDAGCIAKEDWLEKLTGPFKDESVGLAAGFYDMKAKNSMQEAMNLFHGVHPVRFDKDSFLPSTRSVAFKKSVWEDIGGFDEGLEKAGEDTLFFYEIVKRNVKFARVKEARVEWEETADFSLKDSARKFFQYAKGDAQAGIWWHPTKRLASHNIKIASIYLRYFVGLILLMLSIKMPVLLYLLGLLVILYLLWAFYKVYSVIKDWKAGVWGILIQFIADLAVMSGFLAGVLSGKRRKY